MLVSTTNKITIIIKRSKKFNNGRDHSKRFHSFFSLDLSKYLHDISESLDQLDRNDSRDRNRKQQRSQCAIENKIKLRFVWRTNVSENTPLFPRNFRTL